MFMTRNAEILALSQTGSSLPMLSAPTDTTSVVDARVLIDCIGAYARAGSVPQVYDLSAPFLRLGRENRKTALDEAPPNCEVLRALQFPALFHLTTAGDVSGSVCGFHPDQVRWAARVWPTNSEPF